MSGSTSSGGKHPNLPHFRWVRTHADRQGRFSLQRALGEGGMAQVFLAWDNLLERPVALKLVHPELASRKNLDRLRVEGFCLAGLRHPNVLTLYDAHFGEEHDPAKKPFLVTEFIPGETLAEFAATHGPLPGEVVGMILWTLAQALAEAHAEDIVHRDVKPANVLIDRGHPGRLVLCDFHVALLRRAKGTKDLKITGPSERPGSPAYMSPEQTRGRSLDGRSDVFSLGVLGYELATGKMAFGPADGETHALGEEAERVLFKRIRQCRYDEGLLLRTPMPGYVREALERCLRARREERWRSAGELAAHLEKHLRWDGLWPVEEELGRFFRNPRSYGKGLWRRLLDMAVAGAKAAMLVGKPKAAEERVLRAMEVMPPEEQLRWMRDLEEELARREALVAKQEVAEAQETRSEAEQAEGEGSDVPPPRSIEFDRSKDRGKAETMPPRQSGWRVEQVLVATNGVAQGAGSWRRWVISVGMVLVLGFGSLGGLWWKPWPREGVCIAAAKAPLTAEEEAIRRKLEGMTNRNQVKDFVTERLMAGDGDMFSLAVKLFDDEDTDAMVEEGTMFGFVKATSLPLDSLLAHIEQYPRRRSAHTFARLLGMIADRDFQSAQTPDARIVPILVNMVAGQLNEGTGVVWRPLDALKQIAQHQKLPEADLLMTKTLAFATEEGERADSHSIHDAVLVLLTNGGDFAAREMRMRMRNPEEHPIVRRAIAAALDEYVAMKLARELDNQKH